jgi:hypothetical protein
MFTRTFSVGRTRVLVRAVSLVFALGLLLSLAGCPMEDDDPSGTPGLDSRLVSTWEFDDAGYGGERYIISNNMLTYGSLAGIGAEAVFTERFAGTIVHAESYTKSAGIIIIEFTAGHEEVWETWSQDTEGAWVSVPINPQPTGKFYGIYYHHLKIVNDNLEVFFANTTDQDANYGPTVTDTLEKAIEKFSIENMNQLMDIDAGSPVHKVE